MTLYNLHSIRMGGPMVKPLCRSRHRHLSQEPVGSWLTLAVSLMSVLTVWACGGKDTVGPGTGNGTPTVATVALTPGNAILASLGETVQLTASAQDASGNAVSGKTFTWSSSASNVATVDASSGVATARANGTTTITATTDGVSGLASLKRSRARQTAVKTAVGVVGWEAQCGRFYRRIETG